jgi:hypothetical protein
LRVFAGLLVTGFTVTLAVIVGNRLSDEALAVLAGAVCGVGAAIPTSLLIVAVSRRRDRGPEPRRQQSVAQGAYPPVVVVTPPGGQGRSGGWNALPPSVSSSLQPPMERHFTVVGGSPADEGAWDPWRES